VLNSPVLSQRKLRQMLAMRISRFARRSSTCNYPPKREGLERRCRASASEAEAAVRAGTLC
jgi:hypothetical protein